MNVGRNDECPCGSGKKFKRCCAGNTPEQKVPRGLLALIGLIVALAGVGFIPSLMDEEKVPASTTSGVAATAAPPAAASAPVQASAATTPLATTRPAAAQPATDSSQPPFPGAVWSAAHGHWHGPNSATTEAAKNPVTVEVDGGPQPVEVASQQGGAGMVWSKEHNHWHKAAPTSPISTGGGMTALEKVTAAIAEPLPPTPDNPIGLRIGGKPVGLQPQPAGEAPAGKVWSPEHGHWHDVAPAQP